MRHLLLFATAFFVAASLANAQTAPDGAAVFQKACASCHANPGPDSRAPTREVLKTVAPEAILTTLTVGNMFRQGSEITDAERRAVAAFLAGRPVGTAPPPSIVGNCTAKPTPLQASALDSGWNGWGAGAANTRFQPAAKAGLTAANVPRLKLKWAYGFPGVNSARSQPAVLGGRLFIASESGDVVSLDAKRGCTYWSFHAQAGIRTAISIGAYKTAGASGFAAYFSDGSATAYAVDTTTGKEIWHRKVDDHPYARATGSLTVHQNRVYVPTAGVGEEGQGGSPKYECCTFRGSVTALDASTGAVIWKSYTITEEPKPRSKNAAGVQTWGPAGAGVWGAPTVDPSRRSIYITTGNNYSSPVQPTSDAIIAMDMDTGKIKWAYQPTTNDVWTGGCRPTNPADSNCPEALGPDHDFSISPMLKKGPSGRDFVIALQKSGMAYAVDPDKGTLVWQYKTSDGSGMGGQWGISADDAQVYFGVNGKGAVLMTTSYANRTSPVIRGAYILSKLIGTPPPSPPPNVEAFPEIAEGQAHVTVRGRLEMHRDNPACQSCHSVIDPLGLALENYNAVGQWRAKDEDAGIPIDASGQLTNGTPVKSPADLWQALVAKPERFAQTFTEKLLTFALGRELQYYDMPTLRRIVREAADDNYTLSALVLGIVQSEAFRMDAVEVSEVEDANNAETAAR